MNRYSRKGTQIILREFNFHDMSGSSRAQQTGAANSSYQPASVIQNIVLKGVTVTGIGLKGSNSEA